MGRANWFRPMPSAPGTLRRKCERMASPSVERAFYRIQYPPRERPSLVIDGRRLEVLDVSEFGVRFRNPKEEGVEKGQRLVGTLRLGRRRLLALDGDVIWMRGDLAAVKLRTPIPFGIILDEQRYLRSRYSLTV